MSDLPTSASMPAALASANKQRSHLLVVLSDALKGKEDEYGNWFSGHLREAVLAYPEVLEASHLVEDEIDVTGGAFPKPPYRHVALYELAIDGAEQAGSLIAAIGALHADSCCAKEPATWLYYPLGEKVGIPAASAPGITIAYANGSPGQEDSFREWYATRHIRHALNISALSSGQCFERTLFQQPGAIEANYHIVAVYEQTGTTQAIVDTFLALPQDTFAFPAMDLSRFSEVAYRRLG